VSEEHMCVLECIYIAVYKKKYKKLDGSKRNIICTLKKIYKELFDKQFPEKFEGLDIMKTLEHATNKYKLKFIIYHYDDDERLTQLEKAKINIIY
jgi:hypothetical protein